MAESENKNVEGYSNTLVLLGGLVPISNTIPFFPNGEQAELISLTAAGRALIGDALAMRAVVFSKTGVSGTTTATGNFPSNTSGLTFLPMGAIVRVSAFAGTLSVAGTITIEGFAPLTLTAMNAQSKCLPLIPLTTPFAGIGSEGNLTHAVVASTGVGLTLTLNLYVWGIYV